MGACLALFWTVAPGGASDTPPGPARFFIFGDSLSDDGATVVRRYPKRPRFPAGAGRASNGIVWHEYMRDGLLVAPNAKRLAKAPGPKGRLGGSLTRGVNFAHGGAQTRSRDDIPDGLRQAEGFQMMVEAGRIPRGAGRDLCAYWLGGNDALAMTTSWGTADASVMLANVDEALLMLGEAGCKRLLLFGLPEIGGGFLGVKKARGKIKNLTALNETIRAYNDGLRDIVDRINAFQGQQALYIDIAALMRSIEAKPQAYGFKHVRRDCRHLGACNATVFSMDGIHPTTAGHAVIANYVRETAAKAGFALFPPE